ncbi:MAG: hypothetical protein AAF361_10385, partial [Bacteroidota bacterium]
MPKLVDATAPSKQDKGKSGSIKGSKCFSLNLGHKKSPSNEGSFLLSRFVKFGFLPIALGTSYLVKSAFSVKLRVSLG